MVINVLDKGWVELQDIMGDDLAIVNAARVSYLGESEGTEKDKKLLFYLMENRHTTPFEAVEFRFRVHAPEVVLRQWVRHRTGTFNIQSRRYTEVKGDEFYVPQTWRLQDSRNKQGSIGVLAPDEAQDLTDSLYDFYEYAHNLYTYALHIGVAREQARLFLPGFAVYSTFVWKTDAHNLMNFLRQRMSLHAQYEIREYANAIYQIFKEKLPWTAEAFERYILSGS